MKHPIYVRPDAEVDLEEAALWYEKQRSGLGDEFLGEVQQTWNTMAENPYLYTAVHRNTRRALTRRFPFGIYYRIEHDAIVIIAVMHGSRDPKTWQRRL